MIDNVGDKILVSTNHGAPNWRVVLIDPAKPAEANWQTVLAERPEPIESATTAGGKLFATYLKDVTTRAYVYSLDGKLENEIALPGPGSAGGFGGPHDAAFVFYTFNSLSVPPTIYRYDIATRQSSVFRAPTVPGYDASQFETKQVFYPSKDGTRIPMFLVYRKGLKLDGNNPTLLYAYGGFNIVLSPTFSAARIALLEQGFVYASANLRGGGEYGENWHRQGMKLDKQNVFDDFIAAAEWLIAQKYTSSAKLAIQGGSNGGLLVGAVMNQRPELFRVGIPQVGVMDMLRFHKFTIGWNWIADYGSSDNADEFKALYAYSPLHNIKPGVKYPATLITTADHDDRVVPAHSFKYAATLQSLASRENPVLIRIETKSGHGASSLTKQLETTADIDAFVMHESRRDAEVLLTPILVDLGERFLREAERIDGCGNARVDRDLHQGLADLFLRCAVADRAFDVNLELVRPVQRGEHRDVEQAARLLRQAFAAPHRAPAVLGDELLERHVEVVGVGERLVDEFRADHRFADRQALVEHFFIHLCFP